MRLRRYLILIGALAIALFMGAAERGVAQDTIASFCSAKPLCASITSQDEASKSPAGSPHYFSDSVTVSYDTESGAKSNLVNIVVKVTWRDVVGLAATPTTSDYVDAVSDPRCTRSTVEAFTLNCDAPKDLRPGDPPLVYGPLVFRTARDDSPATDTEVTVQATAKEQITPKGGSPNEAVVILTGMTSYEGDQDRDISIAGKEGDNELAVTLATLDRGGQISTLNVPGAAARGVYEVIERSYDETDGGTCPAGLTCFGQEVATIASGLAPVNLWSTYVGRIPGGLTEGNLVVVHDRTGDTPPDPVTISTSCGTTLFSGVTPAQIPCRNVKITRGFLPGGIVKVEIDVWDIENGSWGFG